MIALGLGLENTIGLLQIFEGNENAVSRTISLSGADTFLFRTVSAV